MNHRNRFWTWLVAFGLVVACRPALAQQDPPTAAPKDVPKDAAKGQFRKLAPGVMISVDSARQLEESYSRHDIVELTAINPKWDWAKQVAFRHDVWTLDFKFKPVRMMWVDVPQPSGQMQRKLVWYMVYSVTNPGKTMHPVEQADGTYKVEYVDQSVRFIPQFFLEAKQSLQEGVGFSKVYPDHVIPVAATAIRDREDPARKLLNTAEIGREIAVGDTLWGVATWEDIDSRLKRFSIYVQGLTNAYRWKDDPEALKDPSSRWVGKGRKFLRKTLKLNFWRPGDEYYEHEEEIRYGVPGEADYQWVWIP